MKTEGFIDLGEKYDEKYEIEMPERGEMHYPSLYFDSKEELKNLPDEGTAIIKFKKRMQKETTTKVDGKETKKYCVELEIHGIKPSGKGKSEESSESARDEDAKDAIKMGIDAAEKEVEETEEE
jgi:hypothetical protein